MRILLLLCCFFIGFQAFAQDDDIDLIYLEDQVYLSFSYNLLNNKPDAISQNGFSGGLSLGFIRDIPINKNRNFGLGLGVGYRHDVYIQDLKITKFQSTYNLEQAVDYNTNSLRLHALEFPFELRWRTSTPTKYKFWRVYTGLSASYYFGRSTKFTDDSIKYKLKNLEIIEKWQYELFASVGYGTWNLFMSVGLNPIFDNQYLNNEPVDIKQMRIGLKFYIM